jgi:hypothetical protein
MPTSFQLCPVCLAQFQALQFDAAATIHSNLMPFGSIFWGDEMPPRDEQEFIHHKDCKFALIRLISARKQLWKSGCHTETEQALFAEARKLIPGWPGFSRLSLTPDQRTALQFCEEETDDLMDSFRKDAAVFAVTDEGGGVATFTAYPHPPQPDK